MCESLEPAEIKLEEGRRPLSEAESLLQGSERIREGAFIESGRQLAILTDRCAALTARPDSPLEGEASTKEDAGSECAQNAVEAATAGSFPAPAPLQAAIENESLRALIFELVSGRETSDDTALRASIEYLGRAVSRLHADGNGPRKPVLCARKEATAVGALPNPDRTGFSAVRGHQFSR